MTGHKPLTRQTSPWLGRPDMTEDMLGVEMHWFQRNVHDGILMACVGLEPQGWHLSVSFRNHKGELSRYPTWDEQVHACRELLPTDRTFMMVLPPDEGGYVALHDTTFHWHEARCQHCGGTL